MDILLLGIYAFFVWLIFFKFKWLPWNTISMVVVVTIPVVALTALILTLNVVAPSAQEVRVINRVLQVVPMARGQVIEVAAEGNRLYKKGDILLRINPTPYKNAVDRFQSKLLADESALESSRGG